MLNGPIKDTARRTLTVGGAVVSAQRLPTTGGTAFLVLEDKGAGQRGATATGLPGQPEGAGGALRVGGGTTAAAMEGHQRTGAYGPRP